MSDYGRKCLMIVYNKFHFTLSIEVNPTHKGCPYTNHIRELVIIKCCLLIKGRGSRFTLDLLMVVTLSLAKLLATILCSVVTLLLCIIIAFNDDIFCKGEGLVTCSDNYKT